LTRQALDAARVLRAAHPDEQATPCRARRPSPARADEATPRLQQATDGATPHLRQATYGATPRLRQATYGENRPRGPRSNGDRHRPRGPRAAPHAVEDVLRLSDDLRGAAEQPDVPGLPG